MTSAQLPSPSPIGRFLTHHRIGLWRAVLLSLFAALLLGPSRWHAAWPGALLVALGITLVAFATVGRLWCALYVSGRKSHSLVTQGPYSVCRHPLYVCNLLGLLGLGALTESFLLLALVALAFLLLYPAVMSAEEGVLASRFTEYEAYVQRTPRFVPRPSLYHSAQSWRVDTGAYARNVGDSVWFILLGIVIELLDRGHEAGLLQARVLWP